MPPSWTIDRRTLLQAGAGLAASVAAGPVVAQAKPVPVGMIDDLRGEAFAEQGSDRRKLSAKGEVYVGDLVTTGSGALMVLKLGEATTIRLGSQARLKIDRYLAEAGGEFDLQAGHLMFERRGKPATEGITFRSAYGLLAVRGTRFFAGPNRGQFALLVGEGLVQVSAGGRTVLVRPQQGIDIKAPGQPPTVPAAWSVPRIRELQRSFR